VINKCVNGSRPISSHTSAYPLALRQKGEGFARIYVLYSDGVEYLLYFTDESATRSYVRSDIEMTELKLYLE
jgi:hypothetical protein